LVVASFSNMARDGYSCNPISYDNDMFHALKMRMNYCKSCHVIDKPKLGLLSTQRARAQRFNAVIVKFLWSSGHRVTFKLAVPLANSMRVLI
jgi:hypothetical protein